MTKRLTYAMPLPPKNVGESIELTLLTAREVLLTRMWRAGYPVERDEITGWVSNDRLSAVDKKRVKHSAVVSVAYEPHDEQSALALRNVFHAGQCDRLEAACNEPVAPVNPFGESGLHPDDPAAQAIFYYAWARGAQSPIGPAPYWEGMEP